MALIDEADHESCWPHAMTLADVIDGKSQEIAILLATLTAALRAEGRAQR
jgi:hypothetical protein